MTEALQMAFASGFETAKHKGEFGAGDNDYCVEDERHAAWKAGFDFCAKGGVLSPECGAVYAKNCMTINFASA